MDAAKSLIFPERAVAVAIMGTLAARHPGAAWSVKQAPLGFQIVKVDKSGGLSFVKTDVQTPPAMKAEMLKPLDALKPITPPKQHKNSALDQPCLVTLKYVKMTPEYIVANNGGHIVWIQKTSTMGWQLEEVAGDEVMVAIKMPLWYAQKRCFAYNQI